MMPIAEFRTRFAKRLSGAGGNKMKLQFKNWDGLKLLAGSATATHTVLAMVIPVCPLYAPGPIEESTLLLSPASIEESRVGGKWFAVKEILRTIVESARAGDSLFDGIDTRIVIPFADCGVITTGGMTDETLKAVLERHSSLYAKAVRGFDDEFEWPCAVRYCTYRELGVPCDLTIDPREGCPADLVHAPMEERVVERVKRKLGMKNLVYSAESKKLLLALVRQFGETLAVGLLYSYRAPDSHLQTLGNILVNIERGRSLLFDVARFDLHSFQAQTSTVEVSCDL